MNARDHARAKEKKQLYLHMSKKSCNFAPKNKENIIMRKLFYLLLPLVLFSACNFSTSLVVTPGKQEIPAEGGSFVVNIITADDLPDWTAECDSSWIVLSKYSGSGDGKITVEVAKNPRNAARSAAIKFRNESSVFVYVLQAANKNSGGNGGDNGGGDEGGNGGNEGGNGEGGNGEGGETEYVVSYKVYDDIKIVFAPGNLQYNPAKDEWRFAPHQYDMIGENNEKISNTYNGWVDLFGWGATGYMYSLPYLVSIDNSQYGPLGDHDLTGEYAEYDWGVHIGDKITNNPDRSYKWRLMYSWDWNYILDHNQHTLATVCGVRGMLIFPEGFEVNPDEISYEDYLHKIVNDESYLTDNGLVFLPAAGRREGSKLVRETTGWYHTSTSDGNSEGCVFLEFYSARDAEQQDVGAWTVGEPYGRHIGGSVRLVREVK